MADEGFTELRATNAKTTSDSFIKGQHDKRIY
jgi:hypothetical protein